MFAHILDVSVTWLRMGSNWGSVRRLGGSTAMEEICLGCIMRSRTSMYGVLSI